MLFVDTGRLIIDINPAKVITKAITMAKIGRLIKNFDTPYLLIRLVDFFFAKDFCIDFSAVADFS